MDGIDQLQKSLASLMCTAFHERVNRYRVWLKRSRKIVHAAVDIGGIGLIPKGDLPRTLTRVTARQRAGNLKRRLSAVS